MFYRWYPSLSVATCKWQRQGGKAAKVKEWEMRIGVCRLQFWAVSACVFFALVFSGATSRLGGVKPRADEQSERMRQLSAWSLSKSRESCISSVKHFSLVLQASCRLPLELDEHLR